MTGTLLEDRKHIPIADRAATKVLMPWEVEVWRLIAQGHTNRQTVGLLIVGVRSCVELVPYAVKHGLHNANGF